MSDQYLNLLFRGFAISFVREPLVSSLIILPQYVIHNLSIHSINQPIGLQIFQVPTELGQSKRVIDDGGPYANADGRGCDHYDQLT